jgi:hypothetical protein
VGQFEEFHRSCSSNQQPPQRSAAISSDLYSALISAQLAAEQQPISRATSSAIYSAIVGAELAAE